MATHSSIPAWRIPGTGESGQGTVHGVEESDTTERVHFTSLQGYSLPGSFVHGILR